MNENKIIQLPGNFTIECIGGYGKSRIYDMLHNYYDGILIDKTECSSSVDVTIFLTEKGYSKSKEKSFDKLKGSVLYGPITKQELKVITDNDNIKAFSVSPKQAFSMYKHLHLPIYDYINLSLVMGAYKLSRKNKESKVIDISDVLLQIKIDKLFSLQSSMINDNIRIIYESGVSSIGVQLCMEWISSFNVPVYTIFDVDLEDLHTDLQSFLLPFTVLATLQKGFFIVNSDIETKDSEEVSESFDFSLYTTLMRIWNTKEFIPERKKYAIPNPDYESLRDKTSEKLIPNFEESIRKPPIFIIDVYDSIMDWIKTIQNSNNCILVYVGKKKILKF
jgi:hypothetical protein